MAVATVESPWQGKSWRRATAALVVVVAFTHLASHNVQRELLPIDLSTAVVAGWLVGRGARAVFGRPDRRPTARDILEALSWSGISVVGVHAEHDKWNGSHVYTAQGSDGRRVFVKLTLVEDRGGDALTRLYRFLRFRSTSGEEHPFWSPARLVEHEALLAFTAHARGVPTPGVVAVAGVGDGEGRLIAFEEVDSARSLASVGVDDLDDAILRATWTVASRLHESRVAHRDLRLGSFLIDTERRVSLVGFALAESQASPRLLQNDVAELLASTTARVGEVRAVSAAVDVIGADAVAEALGRLQPLALSARTRADLRDNSGGDFSDGSLSMLDDLVAEVCRVTKAVPAPLEQLQRVKSRTMFLFVMSAVGIYALLPEVTRATDSFRQVTRADPAWVLAAVGASVFSYFGAALALNGAVTNRVRFGPLVATQLASQFANLATPAAVGGMALNVRFLEKQGVDPPVAVAAVGLNTVASVVVHAMLLIAVIFSVGMEGSTPLPSPTWLLVGVAVLLGAIGVLWAVPAGRAFFFRRGLPNIRRSVAALAEIARRGEKIVALISGALLVTCAYIAALACAVYAFNVDVPLLTIALVFLGSSIVAAAAPTPGGLGAVEAALVAGFGSVGVHAEVAVPAVVVFRLATFWLPLLPAWVAFGSLQRRSVI